MDDDFTPLTDPFSPPGDPSQAAASLESRARWLHKQLRATGCVEATLAVLQAADLLLVAARALAAELPPRQPAPAATQRPMLRLAQ